MIKLLWLAALACMACKLLSGRWPWELLKESDRSTAELRARTLLGVERSATREDIIDAHKRLITQVHPDRGGSSEAVHEANTARDVLLGRLAQRR